MQHASPPFFPLRFLFFFWFVFAYINLLSFFFSSPLAFPYRVCVRVRVCVGGEGTHLKTLEEEKKKK